MSQSLNAEQLNAFRKTFTADDLYLPMPDVIQNVVWHDEGNGSHVIKCPIIPPTLSTTSSTPQDTSMEEDLDPEIQPALFNIVGRIEIGQRFWFKPELGMTKDKNIRTEKKKLTAVLEIPKVADAPFREDFVDAIKTLERIIMQKEGSRKYLSCVFESNNRKYLRLGHHLFRPRCKDEADQDYGKDCFTLTGWPLGRNSAYKQDLAKFQADKSHILLPLPAYTIEDGKQVLLEPKWYRNVLEGALVQATFWLSCWHIDGRDVFCANIDYIEVLRTADPPIFTLGKHPADIASPVSPSKRTLFSK